MKPQEKTVLTSSGIPIEKVYTESVDNGHLGLPGEFPFTRGVQPDMYRGRLWTMRQYAGFGAASESNARYKYLLSQGQTGLSVAFDLPTQLGLDPDNDRSKGEVGKVGVSIACLGDMQELLEGIDLSSVSTSMTINATAGILLSLYVAVAKQQNADLRQLRGTVQNDLLKEFAARGNYIYPPKASLKLTTDLIEYCSKELPKWNPISVSGYHIREAGSNAIQELAFTIANAITYVEAALARGLDVDDFAGRLSFFWNVHNDFLEEIAKFRASRRIWSNLMKKRFKAKKPASLLLRFHAQTAGSTLTAQQPDNNIMRVAYQAMAAVLGGCQSLHTNGFDEALALPTEKSARIALRTQQILAYETGVTKTVDPLGGSYYLEHLTDELEKQALELLDSIEKRGGVVACLESGFIQSEISGSAYAHARAVEKNEAIIVGVNRFTDNSAKDGSILRISEKLRQKRVADLERWRERRKGSYKNALQSLRSAAQEDRNTVPEILVAVEFGATLGEISDVLRSVYGSHREFTGI